MAKLSKKIRRGLGRGNKRKKGTAGKGVSSSQKIFQQALKLQQNGRLPEAEALYRNILQAEPDHPDALHYLGMLAYQVGKNEIAVELINKALKLRPDYVNAHNNLGIVLSDLGMLEEAADSFRRALALKPDHPEVRFNLANTLKDQDRLNEAVAGYRQALTLKPDYAEAHNNLGIVFYDQAEPDKAADCFRRALALKPEYVEAHYNLANSLNELGRSDEAIASFQQALALKPDYLEALYNMGKTLMDQGKPGQAADCFERALTLQPDYVDALNNLGSVLRSLGRLGEAEDMFRKAIKLQPDSAGSYNNLGNVYKDQNMLDEAISSYQHALELEPDSAEVHNNLGNILKDQGELKEAVDSYRRALQSEPYFFEAHSNLLLCLNYIHDQSVQDYLAEVRTFGLKASTKAEKHYENWSCDMKPEKLRVGMMSGHFFNHPVGYFLENMLSYIDPAAMQLIAYSTHHQEDELTERIRPRFSAWKSLVGMHDEAAAKLIHQDQIHILLDLSGHTINNRLPVFAWKPAPVQASWLGYFASTGIAEIDYVITDRVSVPESHRKQFTEDVWYIPDTRLCFSPPVKEYELEPTPLPALKNGYVTFACFQNSVKFNNDVFKAWSRILQELPGARLLLQNRQFNSSRVLEQTREHLINSGIPPDRVSLEKSLPRKEYLEVHAQIDIILDTFPFPGGTTTCEALWMGVPTVTLAGDTMLTRQGASLLSCAGLTGWVAKDASDYVAKAVSHAADLEKLARLRANLRQQVMKTPLFDGFRFARNFETVLRGMWSSFQNSKYN